VFPGKPYLIQRVSFSGHVRNIQFPFDVEMDTAQSVAREMVTELDLSEQDVETIANMIDAEVENLVPNYKDLEAGDKRMLKRGESNASYGGEASSVPLHNEFEPLSYASSEGSALMDRSHDLSRSPGLSSPHGFHSPRYREENENTHSRFEEFPANYPYGDGFSSDSSEEQEFMRSPMRTPASRNLADVSEATGEGLESLEGDEERDRGRKPTRKGDKDQAGEERRSVELPESIQPTVKKKPAPVELPAEAARARKKPEPQEAPQQPEQPGRKQLSPERDRRLEGPASRSTSRQSSLDGGHPDELLRRGSVPRPASRLGLSEEDLRKAHRGEELSSAELELRAGKISPGVRPIPSPDRSGHPSPNKSRRSSPPRSGHTSPHPIPRGRASPVRMSGTSSPRRGSGDEASSLTYAAAVKSSVSRTSSTASSEELDGKHPETFNTWVETRRAEGRTPYAHDTWRDIVGAQGEGEEIERFGRKGQLELPSLEVGINVDEGEDEEDDDGDEDTKKEMEELSRIHAEQLREMQKKHEEALKLIKQKHKRCGRRLECALHSLCGVLATCFQCCARDVGFRLATLP
jgi:hypothetical protein